MASNLPKEIFITKVATLYAAGFGVQKIADLIRAEVGNGDMTTHRDVTKAIESDELKEKLSELTEAMMKQAKTQLRSSTARLVPKIMQTIEHNLDRHNLNAVPHALNILGFEKNEGEQKDTVLNIVLPGSQERNVDAVQDDNDPRTIHVIGSTESKT